MTHILLDIYGKRLFAGCGENFAIDIWPHSSTVEGVREREFRLQCAHRSVHDLEYNAKAARGV